MKESTRQELLIVVENLPKPLTADCIVTLFDLYSTLEIQTIEDLFGDHSSFQDFFHSIEHLILKEEVAEAYFGVYKRLYAFKLLTRDKSVNTSKVHHENFAKIIKRLVGFDKSTKIMEVGSGVIPFSSILLGSDGYDITTIDDIYLSKECLNSFNVKSYRGLFHMRTKVQGMDLVVGRKPCSAILPMVHKCKKNNIPYFIRLCACDTVSGNVREWHDRLRDIDENINFNRAYAYNLKNKKFNGVEDIPSLILLDEDFSMN